ncbi:MAG: DNA helicase RecG, partial [Candidatus Omnitrophica bacterium]|nr:DNA helicase RecG [Candidatus Omnitrophota bacterium]
MSLNSTSIQYVKGVGPAKKKLFANLGIETVEDLLYFFPRRYEDRRHLTPLAQVKIGEWQTISATVKKINNRRSYYTKKHMTEALLDDGSGRIYGVWFNQPYLAKYLREGQKLVCYGKVDRYKSRLQMIAPEYEVIDSEDDSHSMNCIVPIYSLTRGMGQRYIRKVVASCLEKFKHDLRDELPGALLKKYRLQSIKDSIGEIHFPDTFEAQEKALKRVSFEEFYFFQISVLLRRF